MVVLTGKSAPFCVMDTARLGQDGARLGTVALYLGAWRFSALSTVTLTADQLAQLAALVGDLEKGSK